MPSSPIPEIICVEPDENIYEVVKIILLEKFKIQITHFKRSDEAWNYIQDHKVALVLTRGMLSPFSGFELVKKIKSDQTKKIKVLFMSLMKNNIEKAFSLGADAFITMPMDVNGLTEVVGKLLLAAGW
jgi:DNA-binding response OmpR family regulator